MKAPPCDHCGRKDSSFTSLWLRAQRQLRQQRRAMKELHTALIVARARADHEQARRLDAEARYRRSEDILDLLSRRRCDEIAKREEPA